MTRGKYKARESKTQEQMIELRKTNKPKRCLSCGKIKDNYKEDPRCFDGRARSCLDCKRQKITEIVIKERTLEEGISQLQVRLLALAIEMSEKPLNEMDVRESHIWLKSIELLNKLLICNQIFVKDNLNKDVDLSKLSPQELLALAKDFAEKETKIRMIK